MKFRAKWISAVLATTLVSGMVMTGAIAEQDISVELDGVALAFDVAPQVIDGRTMVPLRKIFEEIGALVKWNGDTQTVTARKSSKTVTLTVDSNELTLDKGKIDAEGNPVLETITLDVPATVVSGRTLVPARAISESFGYDVLWDEENSKVIISSEAKDETWKENSGTIDLTELTYTGNGIEISGDQILITAGGDYSLTGVLANGNIKISTKDRVKLRLDGVSITSSDGPCIFFEDADKAFITIEKGTENTLIAQNSEDGAIYSKENLEIKGSGSLTIQSTAGHGMKASDNLSIENGKISITAASDGIHINETFKMSGGALDIVSVGDGIDSESIVMISGGDLKIQTTATPISGVQTEQTNANVPQNRFPMMGQEVEVEFEKSSKGINAEWMMTVSGGNVLIQSASHAIHCADEIEISGGQFSIESAYEKGISAHGNLTIRGSETEISVTKATEGLESKNVMTIHDGTFYVYATDDAINATGGSSGPMMGPNGGNNTGKPGGGGTGGNPGQTRPGRNPGTNQVPPEGNAEQPTRPNMGDMQMQFDPAKMPNWQENAGFGGRNRPQMNIPDGAQGGIPGGFGGGMQGGGRNMKECLVINGGYFVLYAGDDCLDANGNLSIHGGTFYATNPTGAFTGAFAVVDPDGQLAVDDGVTFVFATSSGSDRNLNLAENAIVVYCDASHEANDAIRLKDSDGNVVYEYTPNGKFSAILISGDKLTIGESYTLTVGEETHTVTIAEKTTVVGTSKAGNMGIGGRAPRTQQ